MQRLLHYLVSGLLAGMLLSACGGQSTAPSNAPATARLLAGAPLSALAANTTSGQWTFCADENGRCLFTGTQTVRYGAGDRYTSRNFDWAVSCDNRNFPDPAPGVAKHCEVTSSWAYCADDHGQCTFGDTRTVRYGAGSSYFTQVRTGGASCDSGRFGDPAPGAVKHCDSAPTTWTMCADENGRCQFSGASTVLYGADGKFATRDGNNGLDCNNGVFNDPAPGAVKHCYLPGLPVADQPASPKPPARIVAAYYPNWADAPRLRDLPASYNMVYLFAAPPNGNSGAVSWAWEGGNTRGAGSHLVDDIAYARTVQGRKIMLSVGGANHHMNFPSRQHSINFINSIGTIYQQLGGFDGLDWNTYEGDVTIDTAEMIWISQQLKQRYPGFLISTPPAPWKDADMAFCKAMAAAGALDYAAPQYYDGPNLNDPAWAVDNLGKWVTALGSDKVVIGMEIHAIGPDYPYPMSADQAKATWLQAKAKYPGLRGAFSWQVNLDEAQGWPFANGVAPLINP